VHVHAHVKINLHAHVHATVDVIAPVIVDVIVNVTAPVIVDVIVDVDVIVRLSRCGPLRLSFQHRQLDGIPHHLRRPRAPAAHPHHPHPREMDGQRQ
jgi:hypothetical protein